MVFKVKQRANSNYFKKAVGSNFNLYTQPVSSLADVDEFGITSNLQFNWPYDFFSLIEMAKIDAEVEIGNVDFSNYTTNIPEWDPVETTPAAWIAKNAPVETIIPDFDMKDVTDDIEIPVSIPPELPSIPAEGNNNFEQEEETTEEQQVESDASEQDQDLDLDNAVEDLETLDLVAQDLADGVPDVILGSNQSGNEGIIAGTGGAVGGGGGGVVGIVTTGTEGIDTDLETADEAQVATDVDTDGIQY